MKAAIYAIGSLTLGSGALVFALAGLHGLALISLVIALAFAETARGKSGERGER